MRPAHTDLSSILHARGSAPSLFPASRRFRRFESRASIRGTAVLRGRAESKKGSRRTVLMTKAADTKAPELLIRQFLCPRRAARCRDGIHEGYKISNFIPPPPADRPILRLVPISIIGRVSCPLTERSPRAMGLLFTPPFLSLPSPTPP